MRPRLLVASAVAALAMAAIAPIAVSVARVAPGWRPASDTAIIATRARDVFTRHSPLLGQPSTAGIDVGEDVHHPGPLEFWAIAVGQRTVDHPAVSLVVVALVNAVAVVTAVALAGRAGGVATAALVAAALALVGWSLRGEILVEPWNPFTAVLPFAGFLVALLCAVAGGRWWALVPAVLLGSYAAQAHLTFAPLVALCIVAAVAGGLVAGTRPTWSRLRAPLAVAVGAGLLAWSAPIVDVVANGGGNVAALAAVAGDDASAGQRGLAEAVDQSVVAAGWRPAWAQSGATASTFLAEPSVADRALVAGLLVASIALAAVAFRRGRRAPAAVAGVAAVLLVGGTFMSAKLPGAFLNVFSLGNVLWLWPAAALVWAAVAFAAAVAVGPRAIRAAGVAAGVVVAAVAVASTVTPVHRPVNDAHPRDVAALSDVAVRRLDRGARYLFALTPELTPAGAVDKGVLHELVRHGFDVRVPPYFGRSYGWRADGAGPGEVDGVLSVRVGDDAGALADGEEVVAAYHPPAAVRAVLERAEAAVSRRIEAEGGLDEDLFPAFGMVTPATVEEFVADNFLTMAQAGFLGRDVPAWPETHALAEARLQPVEPVTLVLRHP